MSTEPGPVGANISSDRAVIVGGWSDGWAGELRSQRPRSMEISARQHDLAAFAGSVDQVEALSLRGDPVSGRIDSVAGLEAFPNLRHLQILVAVKGGYQVPDWPSLESCDLVWQESATALLRRPGLQSASVSSLPVAGLRVLPENPSLTKLWLRRPALQALDGLERLPALSSLRLSQANALAGLRGIGASNLVAVDLEHLPRLEGIAALAECAQLQHVRIMGAAKALDPSPLGALTRLRRLALGGTGAPCLPWLRVVAGAGVEHVSGFWDPALSPESALRSAVAAGRAVTRFDPVGGRGVRALVVEIA